jgi:hypothetical protein
MEGPLKRVLHSVYESRVRESITVKGAGVRRQDSGDRIQETGFRRQNSGDRIQQTGVRGRL